MNIVQCHQEELLVDKIISQLVLSVQDEKNIRASTSRPIALANAILGIRQQIDNPTLSSHDIASQLDISNQSLVRLFKRQLNITPNQFIFRFRLELASQLLSQELSVSDVAVRVGFTSANYFTRQFKRHYGYVPSRTAYFATNQPSNCEVQLTRS